MTELLLADVIGDRPGKEPASHTIEQVQPAKTGRVIGGQGRARRNLRLRIEWWQTRKPIGVQAHRSFPSFACHDAESVGVAIHYQSMQVEPL